VSLALSGRFAVSPATAPPENRYFDAGGGGAFFADSFLFV
jgi:hypothetical protein